SAKLDDNDIENMYIHKLNQDSVYFITGKFRLELAVSSCRVKDADSGYQMTMEIKPYLTAEMCGPVYVVNEEEPWLTPNLLAAAEWLSKHNCYIKPLVQYMSSLSINSQIFPTAYHNPNDLRAPPFQRKRFSCVKWRFFHRNS
ncbi:3699_t:CDS:2, partial [Paraglomus occultum]